LAKPFWLPVVSRLNHKQTIAAKRLNNVISLEDLRRQALERDRQRFEYAHQSPPRFGGAVHRREDRNSSQRTHWSGPGGRTMLALSGNGFLLAGNPAWHEHDSKWVGQTRPALGLGDNVRALRRFRGGSSGPSPGSPLPTRGNGTPIRPPISAPGPVLAPGSGLTVLLRPPSPPVPTRVCPPA